MNSGTQLIFLLSFNLSDVMPLMSEGASVILEVCLFSSASIQSIPSRMNSQDVFKVTSQGLGIGTSTYFPLGFSEFSFVIVFYFLSGSLHLHLMYDILFDLRFL
jgi:hypothetical protein